MRLQRLTQLGLVALAALILSGNAANAAKLNWKTDFRKAAKESGRLKKPMLVEITASWCGYCHKMLQQTFTDKRVVDHVNVCFVPVILDADTDKQLVNSIGVEGLPTTVIISPDLKVIRKITGYQTAQELDRQLEAICKRKKKTPGTLVSKKTGNGSAGEPNFVFGGYCLVAMMEEGKLRKGKADFVSKYRNQTVRFDSEEYKQKFDKDPEKYWPLSDGNCPVSVVDDDKPQQGNPKLGVIYRGRLCFFCDEAHQQDFIDNPDTYYSQTR